MICAQCSHEVASKWVVGDRETCSMQLNSRGLVAALEISLDVIKKARVATHRNQSTQCGVGNVRKLQLDSWLYGLFIDF